MEIEKLRAVSVMLKKLEGETLPKGTASLINDIVDDLDDIKNELSDGSLSELLKM